MFAFTRSRSSRLRLLGVLTATVLLFLGLADAPAAWAGGGQIVYTVKPLMQQYNHSTSLALPPPSQCVERYGLECYTPELIRSAYDIPSGWTGAGESIAIIDAYGSPTVQQDLDVFSQAFGLPHTTVHVYCAHACPKTTTAHKGQPLDWAGETSLDVQWAHAIAPAATINLVIANNNYGNAINNAVRYAIDHNLGDVISMSYGAMEPAIPGHANNLQIKQSHRNFEAATAKGISLFASSGDDGASAGTATPTASYPASDPLVTAVGGTNLYMSDAGAYKHETAWGDQASCPLTCAFGAIGATGGSPSTMFAAPAYQRGVNGSTMRSTSDVSYNASVYTAVMVYVGYNANPEDNGFAFFGGTSEGAPQWAAIGALADQQAGHRLGQLNPALYGLAGTSAFHDVTSGNNAWGGPGFNATTGYDYPTGLGSPDVADLIHALTR